MLIELVRAVATIDADRQVLVGHDRELSYGALEAQAVGLAAGLSRIEVSRFGFIAPDPFDALPLLVASSMVAAEACAYPPGVSDAALQQLARRFDHEVVVATQQRSVASPVILDLADLRDPPASAEDSEPREFPVLILTTGSTGVPKGARHDWARLVAAVRARSRADERWLLGYNLNQFAGIQVVVHALVGGATIVIPASNQPSDAAKALGRLNVTHASGTPTFWRLLLGELDAEAEVGLRQITLGGEAVSEGLLNRVREKFPDARISQIYGGSEIGTVMSVRDGRPGLPRSVLDRPEDADVRFRIRDGQLEVRSASAMSGYWDQEDLGKGGWWRTGDMVEVSGDRIAFVGRADDIVNVGGVKVHPLPVEELIEGVAGVKAAAVFGRPNPVTGAVVVAEIVVADGFEPEHVVAAVRSACQDLPRASQPARVDAVDGIKLRGSKVVRRRPADG